MDSVKIVEEKKRVQRTRDGASGRRALHAVFLLVMAGDSGARIGKKVMMICRAMSSVSLGRLDSEKQEETDPECLFAKEVRVP